VYIVNSLQTLTLYTSCNTLDKGRNQKRKKVVAVINYMSMWRVKVIS